MRTAGRWSSTSRPCEPQGGAPHHTRRARARTRATSCRRRRCQRDRSAAAVASGLVVSAPRHALAVTPAGRPSPAAQRHRALAVRLARGAAARGRAGHLGGAVGADRLGGEGAERLEGSERSYARRSGASEEGEEQATKTKHEEVRLRRRESPNRHRGARVQAGTRCVASPSSALPRSSSSGSSSTASSRRRRAGRGRRVSPTLPDRRAAARERVSSSVTWIIGDE